MPGQKIRRSQFFIASAFTVNQVSGIQQAFTNWQSSNFVNKSGVTFIFVSGTPTLPFNYVEVKAEDPPIFSNPDASGRGGTRTFPGFIWSSRATIWLKPVVTSKRAI